MTGNNRKIGVAASLDFGTCYSGPGWTEIKDSHDDPARRIIHLRYRWPGQPYPYPKTLTALLFSADGTVAAWGHDAVHRWREQQASGRDFGLRLPLRWFKMALLGRSSAAAAFARPPVMVGTRDAPEELITAYLRQLYHAALQDILQYGYREDEIRWCLTVPAQWDDRQKQVMRKAAVAAGMPDYDDRLIIALEPEAAAHYARVSGVKRLEEESSPAPSLMRPGVRFMVVDCGGGTVDMTTYRNDDQGQMVEVGKASGDALGSQCLNAAFVESVLIKRLGGIEEFERLEKACPVEMDELLERFERDKLHVSASSDEPMRLPLPAQLERRLSRTARRSLKDQQDGQSAHIIVAPGELRGIFEQVVPHILELVDRQLTEVWDHDGLPDGKELVLLAGGFAASPYLQQRAREHLKDRADLLVLPDPGIAVLAGAVHFAYAPQTRARRSKYTYGMEACQPFDDQCDPADKKTVDSWGKTLCSGRFSTFVTAGQTVVSGEEVSHVYLPVRGDQTAIDVGFYASATGTPRYVDEPGCEEIGTLTISLEDVMHLGIERRNIDVSMQFGETEIRSQVKLAETGQVLHHTLEFHEQ